MFAIVNIKGRQYKITENQKLFVPRFQEEVGSRIKLDDVIIYSKDGKGIETELPKLKVNIQATILGHSKDDKVLVFKKKRRKGYKRTRGHRQEYTEIEINKIGDGKPQARAQKSEITVKPDATAESVRSLKAEEKEKKPRGRGKKLEEKRKKSEE